MNNCRTTSAHVVLVLCLASATVAFADERPAARILEDYNAVEFPKPDPQRKDAKSVQSFREAWQRADARRAALALELFHSHPAHDRAPKLLLSRWQARMMSPETARPTITEIDNALPHFKDAKLAREASFMRAIATIVLNTPTPQAALPVVNEFIRRDPKDPRGALLLNGLADMAADRTLKATLFKRLIAEYPTTAVAGAAESKMRLLDMVGKPLDLTFVDAITGSTVSIKGLSGKVVVIDFWATWCGPCVAEMPQMKELYAQYHGQGVEFIGVSLDLPKEEGGLDKLKAFVAKSQIGWPQYYQGNGWESEFSQKMGIASIPQVFLIDALGNLASADARGRLHALLPEYLARAKKIAGGH